MYAELVEGIFARAGHRVTTVGNGRDAWSQVQMNPTRFDVVVTDQQMPELSGDGLVQLLRASHYPGRIVVHAASLNAALVGRFQELAVDHIVSKGRGTDSLVLLTESLFS